jgi:hypothetical protein
MIPLGWIKAADARGILKEFMDGDRDAERE